MGHLRREVVVGWSLSEHSRQIVCLVSDRYGEVKVPKSIGIQKIFLGIKH